MLHIVLYCPEIPQNTGNIGRLCALTNTRLHLIHPLGFQITEKQLRRSGMDYWKELDVHEHESWEAFMDSDQRPQKMFLLTTKATKSYWDVAYNDGDGLVFGNEGHGAPEWLHEQLSETRITLPQYNPKLRSLNLATAAGITLYEGLRQTSAK